MHVFNHFYKTLYRHHEGPAEGEQVRPTWTQVVLPATEAS